MVGRLLERYALSMAEIDIRTEGCVQVEIPTGGQRRRPIDGCVPAIARFCDCKVWLSRGDGQARYVLFGFAPDTALASYLFAVIDRAMRSGLAAFPRRSTPGSRASPCGGPRKASSTAWRTASPNGWTPCTASGKPPSPLST